LVNITIMKTKSLKNFYKLLNNEKYYPWYILLLSAAVLFFQLEGSVGNWDEAAYSQIAKEGLQSNNWIDFHYFGKLWFEKPPLVIWLTMISFKIFGINEFAVWFFPVIFGIFGVVGTYYLGKYLFNSKVGLFAALILLSVPHYVLMARNNMMDIFLVSNSVISFLFLIKSKENSKYLILSAVFLGLAFMSKNVIALLNLPVFFYYFYLNNQLSILRNKYFYLSLVAFLAIVLPWHLVMFLEYKWDFWNSYIGFHLITRYTKDVVIGGSEDILHYFKVVILRSGSWWFVLLALSPIILKDILNKINRQKLYLLIFWITLVILFFTSSSTKVHHYILPMYIPFSILIAYGMHQAYLKKSIFLVIAVFSLFVSISQGAILRAADFGESMLLLPFVLRNAFFNYEHVIYAFVAIVIAYLFYNYFSGNRKFALKISLILIFLFAALLPLKPDRFPLSKEVMKLSEGKKIETIYYFDYYNKNAGGSLRYYNYPIKIEVLNKLEGDNYVKSSSSYCLINRTDFSTVNNLHRTKKLDYDFYPCEIAK